MTQLYLISPPKFELADFRKQLEAALGASEGGFAASFQLRLKDADDAEIIAATKELLPICRAHDVAFIMNDRVDLCVELELDGCACWSGGFIVIPAKAGTRAYSGTWL